jgi:heterodisulfide reductase subunit B2
MKWAYYPGCSLHATGRQYAESIEAIKGKLDLELAELEDWNCCGATAYMSVNEMLAFSLSARNLALAAKQSEQLVIPCNACFTNLRKTEHYIQDFPEIREKVNEALAEADMSYSGGVKTKHFLEAVVEDIGLDKVEKLVTKPLSGLRVAPYYGCQIVRPYGIEKGTDQPMMLDNLLARLGATVTKFAMKTTCCGGSLITTQESTALRLCRNLLLCAQADKADVIAVACPLCQMNLDGFQGRINKAYGTDFQIPIVYFTQLMGLAFGVEPKRLGLSRSLVPCTALERVSEVRS